MSHTLHLEKKYLDMVYHILGKYPYTFYAFGSRVRGTQSAFSDLDLCYREPIPLHVLSHIKEEFEESNFPYTVDFVNWQEASQDFKALIKNDLVPIKQKNQPLK